MPTIYTQFQFALAYKIENVDRTGYTWIDDSDRQRI